MNILQTIQHVATFLIIMLVVHLLVCRTTGSKYFMLKSLGIGGLGVFAYILFLFNINQADILGIYLVATGWLAYVMFFINLLNSVTLKMLSCLAQKGEIKSSEFEEIFNESNSLSVRLNSMEKNNFIETMDNQIVLEKKGIKILKVVSFLRKILSIDNVG